MFESLPGLAGMIRDPVGPKAAFGGGFLRPLSPTVIPGGGRGPAVRRDDPFCRPGTGPQIDFKS